MNLETKLAAVLLMLRNRRTGLRHIPYDHAKKMSAKQINSLFQFDHFPIPKSEGGPDEPWNLMPTLIAEHREKTRKKDVPQIAKNKRVRRRQEEHEMRMARKGTQQ